MLNRFGLELGVWRCVIVSTTAVAHFNFAVAKICEDAEGSVFFLPGWRGAKIAG